MDLRVQAGGLTLRNPLVLASAAYTSTAAGLKLHAGKGYGAVITKTTTVKPLEGAPRPTVFWYDPEEKTLLSGAEALKNPGADRMVEAIRQAAEIAGASGCRIIGSCTGNSLEEILSICRRFEEAGASAIELNMVCPSTGPHLGEPYARLAKWWTEDTGRAVGLIAAVKRAVRIPVWAKLPLEKLIQQPFLQALEREARPDAVSFVGGRLPNLKIDLESGRPVLPGNLRLRMEKKLPISPMVTGPIKPSTILHTAYLAKLTRLPLVCSGGLTRGADILEAVMAGAAAAQVCKAVYRDVGAGERILQELEAAMGRYGYGAIAALRGCALPHLPDPPLLTVPGAKLE
jgi:dihydroorotate dehydrogenase (NAD+) catalytic subunit